MKKNKILCAALAAVMITCTFSGCGKKENNEKKEELLDANDPVTVTIWHYYNGVQQTQFDRMVKDFNDTVGFEKGIIVEAYSKSSIGELAESVLGSIDNEPGADNPPDIFATYAETAYVLDQKGVLVDLKQYLTDDEIEQYIPEYMSEGTFSGSEIKIFPTAKSTEIMMLNKTDWDKFAEAEGVSTDDLATIEGVVETAEKYYNYTDALTPDVENDGKAFFGRDSLANYMYIGAKQLGEEYVTVDGDGNATVSISKETLRRLWDNYYVPYLKGYFTAQSRYRSDDAKTGSLISLVCSTSGAAYFPNEVTIDDDYSYPIENLVLPVPLFEDSEPYIVQQGAGMSVIKSDSSKEYASITFLKWFTEEERNIEFSISSGYLPVKSAANDVEKVTAANDKLETPMDPTMLATLSTAINEINQYELYTSAPFNKSTETRDYIGNTMQDTAANDYKTASERIASGEDRETVLQEYISDEAFDKWYESFITGLEKTISE